MTKLTKLPVHPAKIQISLGICPVWSVFTVHSVVKGPIFLHVDREDFDQTGQMSRLIWASVGARVILLVLLCGGSLIYVPLCQLICGSYRMSLQYRHIRSSRYPSASVAHTFNKSAVMILSFQTGLSKPCRPRSDPRGTVWSGSTLFAFPSASFGHITQS